MVVSGIAHAQTRALTRCGVANHRRRRTSDATTPTCVEACLYCTAQQMQLAFRRWHLVACLSLRPNANCQLRIADVSERLSWRENEITIIACSGAARALGPACRGTEERRRSQNSRSEEHTSELQSHVNLV